MEKQKNFLLWTGVVVTVYVLIVLLRRFGLLGQSKEEKGAEELTTSQVATASENVQMPFIKDIAARLKKPVSKVTKDDIGKFSPSANQMLAWENQIKGAKSIFGDNELAVYNVFRQIKSQFQLYFFNRFFQAKNKVNLIDFVADFMNDEELYKINEIIKTYPRI